MNRIRQLSNIGIRKREMEVTVWNRNIERKTPCLYGDLSEMNFDFRLD